MIFRDRIKLLQGKTHQSKERTSNLINRIKKTSKGGGWSWYFLIGPRIMAKENEKFTGSLLKVIKSARFKIAKEKLTGIVTSPFTFLS